MYSFAEDRERVKKIYAEAPIRYTPAFPPAPTTLVDREQFVNELAEATLVNSAKVSHPFVLNLVRGQLSMDQLRAWAREGYADKVQTIRNDAMIVATAANLEEMKKQATVVASEAGVDGVGPSHPELWLRFGEGLGLTREEIEENEPTPLTQLVLEAERYRSMSQRIGGLPANLRMGERVSSITFPLWAEALVEKYGVPKSAVIFFEAHEEADEDHSEIGRQVVMARATTLEAQRQIWSHQAASNAKQWMSYDGYLQAVLKVEPVAA